jgi:hypothetical protein
MSYEKLEGNWNASISEFTFTGMAHREPFHVHDSAMNHYVYSDTDMMFSYTYVLPGTISFKMKNGTLIYNEKDISKDFISTFTKIRIGKNIVLCDSIYFGDGNFGSGLCSNGYGRLEGEFKNETTFEGNIIFDNIYQRLTDHTILNYLPIYSYYINQKVPVRLVKL